MPVALSARPAVLLTFRLRICLYAGSPPSSPTDCLSISLSRRCLHFLLLCFQVQVRGLLTLTSPPPAPVSRYVSTPPPPGRAPSLCPTPPGRRAQCTCSQGAEGWLQMRPARAGDRPRARGSVAGLRLARAATVPVGFGWEKMLGAGGLSRYNVPGSKPPPAPRPPPPRLPARPVAGEESGRRDFLCQPSLNISARSSKQKGSFQPSGFGVQGESFSCKLLCGFKGVCSIERKTEREEEREREMLC